MFDTAQKIKFSIEDFFSKYDQIRSFTVIALVDKTFIDTSPVKDMSTVEKMLSKTDNDQTFVEPGGWYEPKDCKPFAKVT